MYKIQFTICAKWLKYKGENIFEGSASVKACAALFRFVSYQHFAYNPLKKYKRHPCFTFL